MRACSNALLEHINSQQPYVAGGLAAQTVLDIGQWEFCTNTHTFKRAHTGTNI